MVLGNGRWRGEGGGRERKMKQKKRRRRSERGGRKGKNIKIKEERKRCFFVSYLMPMIVVVRSCGRNARRESGRSVEAVWDK